MAIVKRLELNYEESATASLRLSNIRVGLASDCIFDFVINHNNWPFYYHSVDRGVSCLQRRVAEAKMILLHSMQEMFVFCCWPDFMRGVQGNLNY